MTEVEFKTAINNIGIDYQAEMSRVVVPYGATDEQFSAAEKMRREVTMKYARKAIKTQKEYGISTPAAFGLTENDV